MSYRTEPQAVDVGTQTLSAWLDRDPETGEWMLRIVVAKHASDPRIDASAVDARLELLDGRDVEASESPTGQLVEAGGSLGMSANADFRFPDVASAPRAAAVEYGGTRLRFEFLPVSTEDR